MKNDELPVPGSLNVHFNQIHPDAQGGGNGGESVAGRLGTGGAAVADAKIGNRGHEAIMNDSELPGEELTRAPDVQSLSQLERCYRDHCQSVSEICIVPLSGGPSGPAHLHAVLVPDFALLNYRRQPNSREQIRFEFQQASILLAPAERPHTFSVRAQPLPRTANGEPDRERLRIELAEPTDSMAAAAAPEADPLCNLVYELIRAYRPAACAREEANLELDLGFDSLDRVLLLCSVEKTFHIALPPEQAARIFTVGDLIRAIASPGRQPVPSSPALSSWAEIVNRPLNPHQRNVADSILQPKSVLSFLAWSAAHMLRAAFARRFRFQVKGRAWLPSHGAYLLIANHSSHLDPLFLVWALPFSTARRLSFMGHTEYFGGGWKAAVARRLKLVPVDSDEHALEGIKLCAEALRRGFIGAVFPEGERTPDGAQQRFHRGIALLAIQLQVPVVPVAIAGTYEVLPRGRQPIRYAPVQVSFGQPLRAERGETEQDLLARAWAAVWRLRGDDARSREPVPRPLACVSADGSAG